MPMKLYGHRMSPRFRRLAIAAAELNAPVELVELNIGAGENRAPEYLAKNPMGKIPTFEDADGWTLWESGAVLVYLGEKFVDRGLFPAEPRARADALRWLFWNGAHLEPSVLAIYVNKVLNPLRKMAVDEAAVANARKELPRYLAVLEAQLARNTWVLGAQFSLIDVALGSNMDALTHPALEFDRAAYPSVSGWYGRLMERPSWKAAR